ncbi:NAD(P)-dependent oxidoreductase [Enterovirga aerilata]|uniref:NAD(P)-dependent oxidoreductase n=1 Tax=Enterovirga aerilata TaxID=2730920 RepID=A0A849IJZ7_9HYPH|nr:NAD(P)-dependent oxidoreductase [Enterovirga sp. DB1703]NNM74253.1 NAD(P)-dependent oxidoreductase [Enterovirga sp. DB1703]
MADPTPLGFIGLGLMGGPMTRRLLAAGRTVTVWNRSPDKLEAAVAVGAKRAGNPAEVAEAAEIVFLNLTDSAAVEAVVFGPEGLSAAPGRGKLVVDFSSIRPDATVEIARRLEAANGMRWVDAPVSGGTKGAEEGSLAIMAGGEAADIERTRPHIMTMAARLTHMGPLGSGQTTKLCNQIVVGCTMAVLAEATRLAANAGIDPCRLPEALAGGFADSKPLQLFVPRMAAGIHDPPLGHAYTMLKDLDSALDAARETGTPAPMAALAAQLFRLLAATRGEKADALELYKLGEAAAQR